MVSLDFSPGLCAYADGLGLAVKPEKWKKIEFENEGRQRKRIGKKATSIIEFATLFIFTFDFLPLFGLNSQAETTRVTAKTGTKKLCQNFVG